MITHSESKPAPQTPSTTGTLIYLLIGLIVWAAQLTLIYGLHTLVCALGAATAINSAAAAGVTLVAAAVLILLLFHQERAAQICRLPPHTDDRGTYDAMVRGICLLSLIAVLWTGTTAAIVDACTQAR